MKTTNNLLSTVDPEITERLTANDGALLSSSMLKLGALASAPLVLAMASQQAFGQELPAEITDVLVFALTLEHIEDAFYRSGLDAPGLIPEKYVGIFNQIGKHEAAHVAFLSAALGDKAIHRPALDLTGRRDLCRRAHELRHLPDAQPDVRRPRRRGLQGPGGEPDLERRHPDCRAADPFGRGAPRRHRPQDRRQEELGFGLRRADDQRRRAGGGDPLPRLTPPQQETDLHQLPLPPGGGFLSSSKGRAGSLRRRASSSSACCLSPPLGDSCHGWFAGERGP
jgi:hypothetical protein